MMKKLPYEILLLLSGGKDSCSLAFKYKEEGLNILAITNDVGFMSDIAKRNIQKTVETLDIDHIFIKQHTKMHQSIIDDYFNDSSQHMKDVCLRCSMITQNAAFIFAKLYGIRIVVMGFTKYSAEAHGYEGIPEQQVGEFIVLNPYHKNYNLKEIEKKLQEHGIITDPTKTNCQFIEKIIATDIERFGENPFKKEIDLLLENNQIDKEEYARLIKFGVSEREAIT